jgi:hypothetical protein
MGVITKYDHIEPIYLPQSVVTYLVTFCVLNGLKIGHSYLTSWFVIYYLALSDRAALVQIAVSSSIPSVLVKCS